MPVPSSTATKSPARTRNAPSWFGEEVEERSVGASYEPVALHLRHRLALADQRPVGTHTGFGEHDEVPVEVVDGVEDVVSDRERQVRRQRPGRRRPHEQVKRPVDQVGPRRFEQSRVDRLELERHRDHLVLAGSVRVVLAGLEIRKRRLALPAVGQDPFPLVDEPSS